MRHIQNIYNNSELQQDTTCAKITQVQKEGKREVVREIQYYNLSMIIIEYKLFSDHSK